MYDEHDFRHLHISTDERVATVTLNRPEVYNAVEAFLAGRDAQFAGG